MIYTEVNTVEENRERQNIFTTQHEQVEEIYKKAKKCQDDKFYDKAFELYKKAANLGSLDAVAGLGWCYLNVSAK